MKHGLLYVIRGQRDLRPLIEWSSHPNIFQLLKVLKNVQTDVYKKSAAHVWQKNDPLSFYQYENKILSRLEFIKSWHTKKYQQILIN